MFLIVLCSTLLQFAAGFFAFKLIVDAGKKWAWTLLSAGIFTMAFRRAYSLVGVYLGHEVPSLSYEVIGLIISILVFGGVLLIGPLIRAMRHVAEKLAESEERYRTVAEFTFDWEYWLAPDGSFVFVSPACERITGYTCQEFMDDPALFADLVHPDHKEEFLKRTATFDALRKPASFDLRIIDRQGLEHWVAHSSLPVFSKKGVFLGTRGSIRNIDPRKQLEEELRSSRAVYESMVQNARCLVLRLDRDGAVTFANRYAEEHFERRGPTLIGLPITELLAPKDTSGPDMAENNALLSELGRTIAAGERLDFECESVGLAGNHFWAEWVNSPVADVHGEAREFVCVGIDVTRRKALSKLKEDVTRIVRHDLKSPLSGIIGIPRIIRQADNITPRQAEMLQAVEDAGTMMLALINQSLEMYKLETGTYEFRFEEFDLPALLREVIRNTQMGRERPVPVTLTLDGRDIDDQQPVLLHAERPLIYTMLGNLIKNAVEASEDKPVSVDIGMDRDCRISISNAGLVPLSIQPRFFEKYATEGKRGGTGLGTYSARLVAEKHGGSIAMCSAPDTGTTVSVRIPREQPDSATARLRHSENQSG
ncbi:MAG: PAS domain-containing sensor histidine kinase [Pseudodesulfovibrio sp.]|uniref:histidine kinase n=1 Tax=Pseudodesulfovibrio aespoeensis (strain ATCC 700646 / DSM 10631 / Aspo-2) TaxID=643562 RepID=E6VY75_PSEA9|nr:MULTISPECIES: PAS domain-containing sensor histidine kinase [Pseudodesulfovibrio]MBU4244012.1 PAS domain-containing sensor histidine kinase [Pseudomonadota bacterium]ADU63889.1 PAS sensor protein [Pseudodesulfovibrio aespoeensis Aspo-2]MBU4378222.1 PAS domain-containing sensor histidine kinase [Pseudomonadota bacterium]MBU4475445.1 PAS domain-containing sensor histidine kinase [Pseudomonadota bacterium]MBU4517325.1 PAS domain-containing sensor histidine kinase [Pseudomonadota bacterium]